MKKKLNFDAFDTRKIDEYAEQARASWGNTPAYREYEKKSKGRTKEEELDLGRQMMDIFAGFGMIRDKDPGSDEAQALVKKLQDFISEHYYTCTKEILAGLGTAYGAGGEMNTNIDAYAGEGTGRFAGKAVEIYCR